MSGASSRLDATLAGALEALATPLALVDLARVERNLARVDAYTRAHGLAWRPHTKTHKTAELSALELAHGAAGVTVATVPEASAMATVARDVYFAYPPVGAARLERLLALPESTTLTVALDDHDVLDALGRAAERAGREVRVRVELDLGMRRVGLATPVDAVRLAAAIGRHRALRYDGITFYPGHIRAAQAEQDAALRRVSDELAAFVVALTKASLAPPIVSGGSTPTLFRSHEVCGVNEIRPGIHVFFDRNTHALGVCGWDDLAYSVLATVVSVAVPGQAVIDAGSKALAKEDGLAKEGGYGALLEHPDAIVRGVSEEHGLVELQGTSWRPRVGDRVRVVPNHVCASVALFDALVVHREGGLVGRYATARGW